MLYTEHCSELHRGSYKGYMEYMHLSMGIDVIRTYRDTEYTLGLHTTRPRLQHAVAGEIPTTGYTHYGKALSQWYIATCACSSMPCCEHSLQGVPVLEVCTVFVICSTVLGIQ